MELTRKQVRWPGAVTRWPPIYMVFFLVVCFLSFIGGRAWAGPAPSVVLLAPLDDPPGAGSEQLQRAIASHLSPYGVKVRLERTRSPDLEQLAVRMAGAPRVAAVVWRVPEEAQLYLQIPSSGVRTRVRAAPSSGDGWSADCDALATIVMAELEPVLAGPLEGDPGADPPMEPADATAETAGTEAPARTGPPKLRIVVGLAYLPNQMTRAAPFLNGIGFSASAVIGRHLELGLGVDIFEPLLMGQQVGDGDFHRWTVRGGAFGLLPAGIMEFGLGSGVILENSRVRNLDTEPTDPDALDPMAQFGIAGTFRFRIQIVPWLAPFLDVGADFYLSRVMVMDGDEILANRNPMQPRFAVGIAGMIPVR